MRMAFRYLTLVLVALSVLSVSSFAEQPVVQGSHELNLSRQTTNPVLEGTVIIKPIDLKDDSPFLRVKATDDSIKDYLIKTCDEQCQTAVNACKGGEQCSIRGKVDESAPSIMAEFVRVGTTATPSPETRTTKTGHVFTRDTSHPKLGEAWRDPHGLIWGDIAKNEDGSVRLMDHKDATDYCAGIGAKLPSKEHFIRLGQYMGAKLGGKEGYIAQPVIANLVTSTTSWSSSFSTYPSPSSAQNFPYTFDGQWGDITDHYRYHEYSVRCVVLR